MNRKILAFIIGFIVMVSLSACGNETSSIETTPSQDVGENINWIILPEEITVEIGEEFQIEYSPCNVGRPCFHYRDENQEEYSLKSNVLKSHRKYFDPNKSHIADDPGVARFIALSAGTTYLSISCGENDTTNVCKVTVVEKGEK